MGSEPQMRMSCHFFSLSLLLISFVCVYVTARSGQSADWFPAAQPQGNSTQQTWTRHHGGGGKIRDGGLDKTFFWGRSNQQTIQLCEMANIFRDVREGIAVQQPETGGRADCYSLEWANGNSEGETMRCSPNNNQTRASKRAEIEMEAMEGGNHAHERTKKNTHTEVARGSKHTQGKG